MGEPKAFGVIGLETLWDSACIAKVGEETLPRTSAVGRCSRFSGRGFKSSEIVPLACGQVRRALVTLNWRTL